jgi:hypothetical protein
MVAIVVTKAAAMPQSCKGRYRSVAVVDVPYWKAWEAFEFYGPPRWLTLPSWQVPGWQPREISERCRDVYRVLWDLGPQIVRQDRALRLCPRRGASSGIRRAVEFGRRRGRGRAADLERERLTMAYVYIRGEPGLWTVGFFDPAGHWHADSDHDEAEMAARRCAWLNGGDGNPFPGVQTLRVGKYAQPIDEEPVL